MVFAHREDFNILDNDQLVVTFVEYSIIDDIPHILLVTLSEEEEGFRVSLWSRFETFSVWVFSYTLENGSDSTG